MTLPLWMPRFTLAPRDGTPMHHQLISLCGSGRKKLIWRKVASVCCRTVAVRSGNAGSLRGRRLDETCGSFRRYFFVKCCRSPNEMGSPAPNTPLRLSRISPLCSKSSQTGYNFNVVTETMGISCGDLLLYLQPPACTPQQLRLYTWDHIQAVCQDASYQKATF